MYCLSILVSSLSLYITLVLSTNLIFLSLLSLKTFFGCCGGPPGYFFPVMLLAPFGKSFTFFWLGQLSLQMALLLRHCPWLSWLKSPWLSLPSGIFFTSSRILHFGSDLLLKLLSPPVAADAYSWACLSEHSGSLASASLLPASDSCWACAALESTSVGL